MLIKHITASEVLDSRGNPTVEGCVILEGGAVGSAIAPPAPRPGNGKPLNCGTAMKRATAQRREESHRACGEAHRTGNTKTTTALEIHVWLDEKTYEKGRKVTDAELAKGVAKIR